MNLQVDRQLPEMAQLWQQTLAWQPSERQLQQFQHLYELILAGNAKLNLTRITEAIAFWEKHLWDSLRGIIPILKDKPPTKNSPLNIIDIGTGAGFPGLPVAIAFPHSSLTLLDSTRKKISFLQTVTAHMGLENAIPVVGRAEQLSGQPQYAALYDIALLRAVAPATVCAEYSLPFLKVGGLAILYRGYWTAEEADALANTVRRLGAIVQSAEAFTTPISHATRHCLYLRRCDRRHDS